MRKESKPPYQVFQAWIEIEDRITCLAPLPEGPETPLLTKMLFPAPYEAPEKKAKKKAKGTRDGLRRKGASDAMSEDVEDHSPVTEDGEEEEEEEEEIDSPLLGGERRGRPPRIWRPRRPRRGKLPLQTAPQRPPTTARSGSLGRRPWPNHKCPDMFCISGLFASLF